MDSVSRKILFSFWDRGYCHYTRIMTLATEAANRGCKIGFVTSERRASEIKMLLPQSEIFVIPNAPPPTQEQPPYSMPLYSHAYRHAQRLKGMGFDNVAWLRTITRAEVKAIEKFAPSVVVNDYRDTIRTAAQACQVPVVGVVQTTGNVDGHTFGWWQPPPPEVVLPDCRESFNVVRREYGLTPISDEREMFSGDISLIPSIPEIDPLPIKSDSTYYVGSLSQWNLANNDFIKIKGSQKAIFSYLGDPKRPQYGHQDLLSKLVASGKERFYIVGSPAEFSIGGPAQVRVKIAPFIPGKSAIEASDLTICHGGNGTVMLSLMLGRPILCIGPYQSCCSSTFMQVAKHGAGILLNHSEKPFDRCLAPDLGENVEIFGYWKTELTAKKIREAVDTILGNDTYTKNAQVLGQKLLRRGGAKQALDIITQHYL